MMVETTPENLEVFLNEMLRELGSEYEASAFRNALERLKLESNPYADLAEMVFFDIVDTEVVLSTQNYDRLLGARVAYRSRVGYNPSSSSHGRFVEKELRKAAREAMKHARITFEQKARKPATAA